jgi:quercetin dioxygenase-like cupin family protein
MDINQQIPKTLILDQNEIQIESIPWTPHATFKGVALKHLVKGKDTAQQASFHLVKVDAGCALLEHTHPGKWELHEVIQGNARAIINNQNFEYFPGLMILIPADTSHAVFAGDEGIILSAKFFPALI